MNVFLTGASSGIGRALAVQLLREGAGVIASARRDEHLETLRHETAGYPGTLILATADVSDEAQIVRALEKAARESPALAAALARYGP